MFRRLSSRRSAGPEGHEPPMAAEPGAADAPADNPRRCRAVIAPCSKTRRETIRATGYVPTDAETTARSFRATRSPLRRSLLAASVTCQSNLARCSGRPCRSSKPRAPRRGSPRPCPSTRRCGRRTHAATGRRPAGRPRSGRVGRGATDERPPQQAAPPRRVPARRSRAAAARSPRPVYAFHRHGRPRFRAPRAIAACARPSWAASARVDSELHELEMIPSTTFAARSSCASPASAASAPSAASSSAAGPSSARTAGCRSPSPRNASSPGGWGPRRRQSRWLALVFLWRPRHPPRNSRPRKIAALDPDHPGPGRRLPLAGPRVSAPTSQSTWTADEPTDQKKKKKKRGWRAIPTPRRRPASRRRGEEPVAAR